jgi:hypothetical protein
MARKRATSKKKKTAKSTRTKSKAKAKSTPSRKRVAKPKPRRATRVRSGRAEAGELVAYEMRGLGSRSAGQSGDTQGLSASPTVGSESVAELLEEGQSFEAEILSGVENAADPDESEVRTKEVPEDDVAEEYRDPQEN